MNIAINDLSATRKRVVVSLDSGEVDTEYQGALQEFSRLGRVPGFRPGKAPKALIEKQFSRQIEKEFHDNLVSKAYRAGLEQAKLEVLAIISVEPGQLASGQPAEIALTVDIRPEFTLPDYTGLPTEIVPTEVDDAEVDKVIEGLRGEQADFKVAERSAQQGDYVKLSYEGFVGGRPILEIVPDKQIYGKVPQTWEEVEGAHEGVIPGLGKHLAGLRAGDKREVSISFPAEFAAAPALAGQEAVYAVEIQEVRERVLPPIDEVFLRNHNAESLDDLKAKVRENVQRQKENQNRLMQRRQVLDALLAKVDFPVPESLVKEETQGVLRQFIEDQINRGVPMEQLENDKQALFESASQAATQRVRSQLVMAKIAEAEKIEVTEKDVNTFILREAMRSGQSPDKVAKQLSKSREQYSSLRQGIIFDKAVDFLVSKATVTTIRPKA